VTTVEERVKALLNHDSGDDSMRLIRGRFRDQLRSARAGVGKDSEGFEAVIHAIERLGKHLNPDGVSLADYEPGLVCLVGEAELPPSTDGWTAEEQNRIEEHRRLIDRFCRQLFLLRQTRNDHAHQGAHARNAARECVRVALRLEDALSVGWKQVKVEDIMVRDVVTTRPGDTLNDLRLAFMENAFTCVPARIGDTWFLLTDRWLARRLAGKSRKLRDAELIREVAELPLDDLKGFVAAPIPGHTRLADLAGHLFDQPLMLVAPSGMSDRLDGVLAPSDVL
jgi:hypothetical protein